MKHRPVENPELDAATLRRRSQSFVTPSPSGSTAAQTETTTAPRRHAFRPLGLPEPTDERWLTVALGLRIPDRVIRDRFKHHKVVVADEPTIGEPREDSPFA